MDKEQLTIDALWGRKNRLKWEIEEIDRQLQAAWDRRIHRHDNQPKSGSDD